MYTNEKINFFDYLGLEIVVNTANRALNPLFLRNMKFYHPSSPVFRIRISLNADVDVYMDPDPDTDP